MSRVGQCPFIPPASTDPVILQLNDQIRQLQLALNNLSVGGITTADEIWLHIVASTVSHIGPSSVASTLGSSGALGVSSGASTLSSITLTAFGITYDSKGHGVGTVGVTGSTIKITTDAWINQTVPGLGSLTLAHGAVGASASTLSQTASYVFSGVTTNLFLLTLTDYADKLDAKGHVAGQGSAVTSGAYFLADNLWIQLQLSGSTLGLFHTGPYTTDPSMVTLTLGSFTTTSATASTFSFKPVKFDRFGHEVGTLTASTLQIYTMPVLPSTSGVFVLGYSSGSLTWISVGAC